ncbi:MAG: PAS domain S-box protein [Alphaproteobacteria bacterium]
MNRSPFARPPLPAAPTSATQGGGRAILYLVLLVGFSMAAALATLGWEAWQKRAELHRQSQETTNGLARIVAEQTARTMQTIDLTLLSMVDEAVYHRSQWSGASEIHDYLRMKQQRSALIRNLFLVDKAGALIGASANYPASSLEVSDRPYFTLHRHTPESGLLISPPMLSRVTHGWIMTASRRVPAADGGFDGVVVASIDLSRLSELLDNARMGDGSEISLFLDSGNLLLRSPNDETAYSSAVLSETLLARAGDERAEFAMNSPVDGIARTYALQRVPDLPIYVLAGIDESAVMRAWRRECFMLAGLAGLAAAAIGLLGAIALRNNRRRENLLRALGESERRFRDFAAAASDRFWETDAEHRLTWHSGLDGTRPDYIGKTRWGNLGIDADKDPQWAQLKRDMDEHRIFRAFRYARPKPDGSLRHRIVSGAPTFDARGVFAGYRGIYSDVTSHVTTQELAQRSRDRFLRAIENLAEGFALYDADDRLVVCNTRFQELYAPVSNSLTRWSSYEDFVRECVEHKLIPEAEGREEEWIAERLLSHRNLPHMAEVERKGRWLQIRERSDKEGGTMILVLDIHEQKLAELRRQSLAARLRMMIDNMPSGCILLDDKRRILDWNPAAEGIFGYTKAEALGADPFDLIVAPEQRDLIERCVARVYSGEEIATHVSVNRTKDGRVIACEWTHALLTDDAGRCTGLLSMARDVSEKRAAEEKMRQATRMEAIGQLTGGIAHDFNNILQVVIGNSEILAESLADQPRLQRWAAMTKDAADRGAELTLRLLAYSRRQTLEPVSVDLKEVVADLQPLIARSIGDDITVTSALPDDLWMATLDRGQIDQALLNIVLNARDAMPNGGTLHIAAGNAALGLAETAGEAKPGDYVCIAVSDTGSGMTPDIVKRAFEPFFSTKGVGKGNGLGLSMVHGFVNQSGGLVRLDSEVGKGTIVRIYFPRAEAQSAAKPTDTSIGLDAGRKTILVVEDNDMVRAYVTAQLESLGHNVIEAENGPAGLAKLDESGHIDLLFTDVIMPGGMNGRELAERAVERRPGLKVLFTSGYDESAITTDGRLADGMFLLKKPYQRKELENKILEVLSAGAASAAA